jgi:hypothetical protein
MKRLLPAVVLAYAVSTCVFAEDHLAPCDNGFPGEYESHVEALAQSAMPAPSELWATVTPSFTPEWSVGVSTVEGRHLLTYVVFDRSFWYSSWVETGPGEGINDPSKGHARAKAKTTAITQALYEALGDEWDRSISATRPSDILILDGETYYFRLPRRCASALSPEPATRSGKLVDLLEELARLARMRNKTPNPATEAEALKKIRELPRMVD